MNEATRVSWLSFTFVDEARLCFSELAEGGARLSGFGLGCHAVMPNPRHGDWLVFGVPL
jgi:hypothetical protein